jgi:succinoglycan biosynthesis transport protein ExoP
MSGKDIQPTGGQPVWPVPPQAYGTLAIPQWAPQNPSGIPEINLATLWRILYEWRWLILGSTGVAVAAAMVVTLLTTPLYRATATLELNPPTVEIMEGNKGVQSFMAGDRQFLATQY